MDLLDSYLGYETWSLRYFIERCRDVPPEGLHARFDVGQGSLHDTIMHIIGNLEAWTDLMRGRPERLDSPASNGVEEYLARFDAAMADFADFAHALASEGRLDEMYVDTLDNPPRAKAYGATILHVLTHTTVHRWEMQHMLQRLGLEDLIEGDALGWDWRRRHGRL